MIRDIEYNDGESRLKGHVEVVIELDGTYTVTQYVEDKKYGVPWQHVKEEDLVHISERQSKGVLKVLKKMADSLRSKSGYDKLQEKGFSA